MRASKRILFKIQVLSLVLLGISIMSMSLSDFNKIAELYKSIQIYIGILFWISLILFVFISLKINDQRKYNRKFRMKHPNIKQIGIISFLKNKKAFFIDIIMLLNLFFLIVGVVFLSKLQALNFILMGTFVISFGLHCILNGVNYIYLTEKEENIKWGK